MNSDTNGAHGNGSSDHVDSARRVHVAIVGGGLGGLALAIGLLKAGVDVLVFEKAAQLRDTSQGVIAIWPNGMQALSALHPDIPNELKKGGGTPVTYAKVIKRTEDAPAGPNSDEIDGTAMFRSLPERFGTGAMYVAQATVYRVLAARVPKSRIRFSKRLQQISESEDCVKLKFADGSEITAAAVVAADGIFSLVRRVLQDSGRLPQVGQVRFFGQTNFSSIIQGYQDPFFGVTRGTGRSVSLTVPGHPPVSALLVSIGGDRTFWQVRVADEEGSFRQTDEGGCLGALDSKQRVLSLISHIPEIKAAVVATHQENIYERSMYDLHPPLPHFVAGRVALMGDAAHAAHSVPGQGANFAFEDATELSWILGRLPSDGKGFKDALQRYEAARIERCHSLQIWAAEDGDTQKKGELEAKNHHSVQGASEDMRPRLTEMYGWRPPGIRSKL